MPWPIGRPRAEADLAYARAQVEAMVETGIAADPDDAADLLLEVGELDAHEHARLLSTEAREQRYGSHA